MSSGKKCCFLTATPRNKSAWDIYNQIKLFHQDDATDLPIDPPNLREFFRLVEKGERDLPELLGNILLRRTRNHILRWYGRDSETEKPVDPSRFDDYLSSKRLAYVLVDGRRQFFPRRRLETVSYSIEAAYARYGLWRYVLPAKRGQEPYVSLRRAGLICAASSGFCFSSVSSPASTRSRRRCGACCGPTSLSSRRSKKGSCRPARRPRAY